MATEVCELLFSLLLQIALGTVTNVEEAVKWLSYTYLYVRMRANPLVYGINHKASQVGPDPRRAGPSPGEGGDVHWCGKVLFLYVCLT